MKWTLIIFSFMFGVSCTTLKPLSKNSKSNLTKSNYSQLIGEYYINPINSLKIKLDFALLKNSRTDTTYKNATIKIDTIDDKHLKLMFISNKKELLLEVRQGKLKNGYFYLKKSTQFVSVSPIVNGITYKKTRIGITDKNNLIVDMKYGGNGFVLFFPVRSNQTELYDIEFKKIKNPN